MNETAKHAAVIGGTRGIGAGVVESLIAKGWRVTATGVSAEEVAAYDGAADTAVLDVTDNEAVTAFFGGMEALDGLVNCAGILLRGREYEIDVFQKVIDINLTGTMRACVAARPLLADGGGAIVNTASMLSYFGGPLVPAYSASKGGVAQLTKALAGAWAEDGVRVNAVAPGWIATEMTTALREDAARNEPILGRTPMKRWGEASEVGALAAWLLSDEASFITGSVYPVDGGYAAM
ncbi:MAG: SDR family oxidoreductase [Pseudomonadota bacterium]